MLISLKYMIINHKLTGSGDPSFLVVARSLAYIRGIRLSFFSLDSHTFIPTHTHTLAYERPIVSPRTLESEE